MTAQHFVRWTCNACGFQLETPTGKQPSGWVGYGFTETGVPLGEKTTLGHLCIDCHDRIEAALEARETART